MGEEPSPPRPQPARALYDRVADRYVERRRPDPRWAARIRTALGGGSGVRVVNVGAGTGSYEPADARLVAVEPSPAMVRRRAAGSAPCVRGVAEALPFTDRSADVALAVLTVHHWTDPARGLAELRRVAPRQVVVAVDLDVFDSSFWLVREYLPEVVRHEEDLVTLERIAASLPRAHVEPLPVPAGCTDGFFGAFWRRPEAYLDQGTWDAISGLARLERSVLDRMAARLSADLADGTWARRHADLLELDELDLGYRLVVGDAARPAG